jgi:hypothetical protein
MSPEGASYMSAYCCDMVRASGIDVSVGNGTIAVGPVDIDLAALVGAIPGVGGAAAGAVTAATTAVDTVLDTATGAITGLPTCTIFDWLAFALQGNEKLLQRFVKLVTAVLVGATRNSRNPPANFPPTQLRSDGASWLCQIRCPNMDALAHSETSASLPLK